MKVRISFTVDIDRAAWAATYGLPEMTARETRNDVRLFVESEVLMRLSDNEVLDDTRAAAR